jgi:hypothetical protein
VASQIRRSPASYFGLILTMVNAARASCLYQAGKPWGGCEVLRRHRDCPNPQAHHETAMFSSFAQV